MPRQKNKPTAIWSAIRKTVCNGGVKVSTGILNDSKRVKPGNLFKGPNLNLNANFNESAIAA